MEKVEGMLHEFEWLIKTAVESSQVDALDVTLDPRIRIPSKKSVAARLSNSLSKRASRRSEVPRSSAAVEAEEAIERNDEEDEGSRLSIEVPKDKGAMGVDDAAICLQAV